MKYLGLAITLTLCFLFFGQTAYGACVDGKIDGIYHTSCFPWDYNAPNNDRWIPGTSTQDDTPRLQRAIDAAWGKLVFDETDYFIQNDLNLHSYIVIEGTGRAVFFATPRAAPTPPPTPTPTPAPAIPSYKSSKIIQTANNKSIFKIGEGVYSVSIRDLALTKTAAATGTVGILMQGGDVHNWSSLYFQFSNLTFNSLNKGIYVNAIGSSPGEWQCDNVRLDHSAFEYCNIGVHINSNNSGWNITSLDFIVPPGYALTTGTPLDANHTYGVFLERSTYTNMDLLIGNGTLGQDPGSAFIYVKDHANLSIRNVVDEGFRNSIYIQGGDRTSPILLMNNFYQSPVTVNASTVVSMANQFYSTSGATVPAYATGYAQIYSYGDKFCFEGHSCTNATYATSGGAQVITSATQFNITTTVPNNINYDTVYGIPALSIVSPTSSSGALLRLGRGSYWFDITRSESDGSLYFQGNQDYYSQYVFDTHNGGKVTLNNDGSVTHGTVTYANLGGAVGSAVNGTIVYCSNCTKATPCASGGNGAMAKRINSAWDCN